MTRRNRDLLALGMMLAATPAWAAGTERVSVDSKGQQGNDASFSAAISPDGRYVAFTSLATNLVAGDTSTGYDIFVHDRKTKVVTRVSVATGGKQANGQSFEPAISTGGRFVAFGSGATNLVKGDTNDSLDVFVHDRSSGKTTRVSVGPKGKQTGAGSGDPSISADGRFVSFQSQAGILVAGDSNGKLDAFVHDRKSGKNTRASVSSAGVQGNGDSFESVVSGDGRFVVFNSGATNLVAGDTNARQDIFVHELKTRKTTRVSVGPSGVQSNGHSAEPSISADGRFVAFGSSASNLVPGDQGLSDIFAHDRKNGTTTLVSLGLGGAPGNDHSFAARISADGRFVTFRSRASNLVADDTNGVDDIFVHDRQTGTTSRVSVSQTAGQADGDSDDATISSDGRLIAFTSNGATLVPNDTNEVADVFVRSR